MRTKRVPATALVILVLSVCSACGSPRATEDDCGRIFDRIVELEVEEMGYRDPVLVGERKRDLARRHRAEIRRCVGRVLPRRALSCVRTARSSEEISHECLR